MPLNGLSYDTTNAKGTGAYLDMTTDVYQSFSGADIQAIYTSSGTNNSLTGNKTQKVIGTLSSITVSVIREVSPRWAMGSADFRAVTKGKRSISGTLTFTVFDRDPLVRDLVANNDLDKLSDQYRMLLNQLNTQNGTSNYNGVSKIVSDATGTVSKDIFNAIKALKDIIGQQPVRYADQLAPFDITISLLNDQGAASAFAVRQIYIVSQGAGFSTHDLESDQVYSYIARFYDPLTPLASLSNI